MGPRSSDACSGPERVLPFILIWNRSVILVLPAGPSTSRSTRPRLTLCPGTARPVSSPGPLRFWCTFDDHGSVAAVIEQGTPVFPFFVRGGGDVASVVSVEHHVLSMVRAECDVALIVRW